MSRRRALLAAGVSSLVLTTLTVAASSSATSPPTTTLDVGALEVLPPGESFAGVSPSEWSARWFQWFLSMPNDFHQSPGSNSQPCGSGQSGPMFFLPAFVEHPGMIYVNCVVPEGTAIYLYLANVECSTGEPPPFFGRDEAELRACAAAWVEPGRHCGFRRR